METLAQAALKGRAVRLEARDESVVPGTTASVLAFSPQGERWHVAVWLHELSALRILDATRLGDTRRTGARAQPGPASFDALSFSAGTYLGWGVLPHRRFRLRRSPRAGEWVSALLPTAERWTGRGRAVGWQLQAANEEVILDLASSLGLSVAVDSDPPMPDDTGAVRCLRLAQWLLTQDEPATRERIYAAFPDDYSGKADARERKFSRDKVALRKLGFALETVQLGKKEEAVGYLLDARSSSLAPVELTTEEATLLWAAGSSALRLSDHPLRDDLEGALRKLLVGAKVPPPRAGLMEAPAPDDEGDASAQRKLLDKLEDAWERRKTITIDYWRAGTGEVTTRDVDVYGWALRRGEWIFVGRCHLREATRIFYLSRCRKLKMNGVRAQTPDYDIPEDFDIRRWSRQAPWDYDVHPPEEATVRFRGSLARIAKQLMPGAKLTTEPSGARLATLRVRNLRGLVRQALAWGLEAELVTPDRGRAMAREILKRVVASEEVAP